MKYFKCFLLFFCYLFFYFGKKLSNSSHGITSVSFGVRQIINDICFNIVTSSSIEQKLCYEAIF